MELGDPDPAMVDAMSLDGDVSALAELYGRWATTYDHDVASHGYGLPEMIVATIGQVAEISPKFERLRSHDLAIIDAGCGTGLVGAELAKVGYSQIDGVDLSPEMVNIARDRGVYRNLTGGVDLTLAPPASLCASAELVTVAGVFTVGHVPPEALRTMAMLARPGGILITSTRAAYYDETDYQAVSDRLVESGDLELVLRIDNAPYTMDSTANYWAYLIPD